MIEKVRKLYGIETAYSLLNLKHLTYTKTKTEIKVCTIVTIGWGETCLIMKEYQGVFVCNSYDIKNAAINTYRAIFNCMLTCATAEDTILVINLMDQWMVEMFLTEEYDEDYEEEISKIEELRFLMALNNTKVIFQYEDTQPKFIRHAVRHLVQAGFPMLKTPRSRLSSLVKCLPDNAHTLEDYRCLRIETRKSLQNFLKDYTKPQETVSSNSKKSCRG